MHTLPLPGDLVWIRQRRWRIEHVRRDRNVVRLDVAHRDRRLTFLAPFDRPTSIGRSDRLRRVRPQEAIARLAHLIGRTYGVRTLASAVDADIAILPHQLEPALAVTNGARRILVADEVGLGKTIAAGLVVAELARRDPASRALIVVPASLREQWVAELRLRFGIDCMPVDAERLGALARTSGPNESPWDRSGVWIASLDFLKQAHVLEGMPLRPWDLVVVDEAHGACGDSDRHEACDELLRRARHCVLLTATPHSGDETRFARLLSLGRVGGDPLTTFRRTRAQLGLATHRRVRWRGIALSEAERRVLAGLMAFESAVLRAAGARHRDEALLLLSVFRKRALSTMAALRRSIDRRLEWLGEPDSGESDWRQPCLSFEDDADELGEDGFAALSARTGLRLGPERSWLRRLQGLVEAAAKEERKVAHLVSVLGRTQESVVVFTEFRHSLEVVESRLRFVRPVSVLHGGQSPAERRYHLERFVHGATSVLLATDVAAQGLNLQSRARWVISLEVPWNPARLEQRIGRVDRIGQIRPVHATVLIARHEAEAGLLVNLARRVQAARQSLGEGVLEAVTPDEAALRSALIEQLPIALPSASPQISICRSWARPGRVAARRLQLCRKLVRRWRAPDSDSTGAIWAYIDHFSALHVAAGGALFVFSVPILNRGGHVVERHVVSIAGCRLSKSTPGLDQLIEAARGIAAQVLSRRVRRTQRFTQMGAEADARFDRALARHVVEDWLPASSQPGLFDGRELRAFEAAKLAGFTLDDDLTADVERRRQQMALDIGRPVLEVAFLSRT